MRPLTILLLLTSLSFGAPATTRSTLDQQCNELAAKWKPCFAAEHLTAVVSKPYIVAGDGGDAKLNRYLAGTIRAATDALQLKFFTHGKPDQPILILLFESDEPYRRLAKEWFGDEDVSKFGYFRHDNVMLMNVGTGTGTLVHELTHALIKPDFPQVPSWFNEGLGSLFEQCSLADGDIRGLVNWRLPDLQRAIKNNELRPLEALIKDNDFYGKELVGINYAQARYLLMYLQATGSLPAYYKLFRQTVADDPTGLKQLKQIVSPRSMEEFEASWRKWVMQQRFE